MKKILSADEATRAVDFKVLTVRSPSFNEGEMIPCKYTCDGEDISPPLEVIHIPNEAVALSIIMDDEDTPEKFLHWMVWNMPVTHHIKENEVHGTTGFNDFKRCRYNGPCPPAGVHHYNFKVYALNGLVELPATATKKDLETAMSSNIIAFGMLSAVYSRK